MRADGKQPEAPKKASGCGPLKAGLELGASDFTCKRFRTRLTPLSQLHTEITKIEVHYDGGFGKINFGRPGDRTM